MKTTFETPWVNVTKEGSPDAFQKMQQVRERYQKQSGQELEEDNIAIYADSTVPTLCMMGMAKCPACGPELKNEFRRVSDFFSEARKHMAAETRQGDKIDMDEMLPKEPMVATAIDDDGTFLTMLTWSREGKRDHYAYEDCADAIMDMLMGMTDVAMDIARLRRGKTCKEAMAERKQAEAARN